MWAVRARRLLLLGVAALALPATSGFIPAAWAGGYDTPMLYSARHMGTGGAAIGYVDDPSALFHNPAGLGHVGRAAAIADLSLLLGRLKGSPSMQALDKESELTVAPMFLVGGAYRLTDWLVAGFGVYPIASAGATYKYDVFGTPIEDKTRLVFIEGSPGLGITLPGRVRLGVGYRFTYVNLQRYTGNPSAAVPGIDFELDGTNLLGFRAGVQWTPIDPLQLGLVYRHKVTTDVSAGTAIAAGRMFTAAKTEFLLPSKLGGGVRGDLGDLGLILDVEYLWNSQNEGNALEAVSVPTAEDPTSMPIALPNFFRWSNELTVRTGVEYRLLALAGAGSPLGAKALALRLGYVFDGKTANEQYPTAFGTPPGPTHVLTAGAGWNGGWWRVDLAYARRFGSGEVTVADLMAEGRSFCAFCSAAGNDPYQMTIDGLYLDVSFAVD